jgi:hypothetical protein
MSGNIEKADMTSPQVDDLLDDLGELVLKRGGDDCCAGASSAGEQRRCSHLSILNDRFEAEGSLHE